MSTVRELLEAAKELRYPTAAVAMHGLRRAVIGGAAGGAAGFGAGMSVAPLLGIAAPVAVGAAAGLGLTGAAMGAVHAMGDHRTYDADIKYREQAKQYLADKHNFDPTSVAKYYTAREFKGSNWYSLPTKLHPKAAGVLVMHPSSAAGTALEEPATNVSKFHNSDTLGNTVQYHHVDHDGNIVRTTHELEQYRIDQNGDGHYHHIVLDHDPDTNRSNFVRDKHEITPATRNESYQGRKHRGPAGLQGSGDSHLLNIRRRMRHTSGHQRKVAVHRDDDGDGARSPAVAAKRGR